MTARVYYEYCLMNQVERLQELIPIQSISGHEADMQNHIAQTLQEHGVESFRVEKNVVAHIKGEDTTRAFIFNGHVDVVPANDADQWNNSPWGGIVEGGIIHGRGTADMKGGIAAMQAVAELIAARPEKPPTDIWFTFVENEEVDGRGTRDFVEWFVKEGYANRYMDMAVLIGEPTSLDKVGYANRGNAFLTAEIEGNTGHSGSPDAIKRQAIFEMMSYLSEVQKEHVRWKEELNDPEYGAPTIAITSVMGDSGVSNKITSTCVAKFDLRTLPTFHDEAIEKIRELGMPFGATISFAEAEAPAGYTRKDSKIVKTIVELFPGVEAYVFEGATDLGFFSKQGIDGVIFGPGSMKQAHDIDEYASVEQIEKAPVMFEKIYYAWAGNR